MAFTAWLYGPIGKASRFLQFVSSDYSVAPFTNMALVIKVAFVPGAVPEEASPVVLHTDTPAVRPCDGCVCFLDRDIRVLDLA
jgi:hypothetical protein